MSGWVEEYFLYELGWIKLIINLIFCFEFVLSYVRDFLLFVVVDVLIGWWLINKILVFFL